MPAGRAGGDFPGPGHPSEVECSSTPLRSRPSRLQLTVDGGVVPYREQQQGA